jgi:hypothetical protein
MVRRRVRVVVGMMSALLVGGAAMAQTENAAPGCTLQKQVYTCNWQAFVDRLNRAETIAVQTESLDRFTARQLRDLIGELGKRVAPERQEGDLTFLLIPIQSTGVHIGPRGEPLATLRIYSAGPESPRRTLLWAETYTGQPDRPWPSTVHELIEQFQGHFTGQSRDRVHKH